MPLYSDLCFHLPIKQRGGEVMRGSIGRWKHVLGVLFFIICSNEIKTRLTETRILIVTSSQLDDIDSNSLTTSDCVARYVKMLVMCNCGCFNPG